MKFIALFFFASTASAGSVTLTPAVARAGERVTATVQGWSACGGVRDLSVRVEGRTIYLHGRLYACHGLVPYTASIAFDAPAAGVYSVEYSTTFGFDTIQHLEAENRLVVRGETCDFETSLSVNELYLPLGEPLRLEWCEVDGAAYRVFHARTASGPFSVVAEVPAGRTAYQVTPIAAGNGYYFVEARSSGLAIRTATVRTTVTDSLCSDTPTSLCLAGRFMISAAWSRGSGASIMGGEGRVLRLTNNTVAFWFFSRENVEVTVKVIDACGSPSPSYWVFASGMTNVAVDLEVVDTKVLPPSLGAKRYRRYFNADGTPFATILDTSAFPCP